MFIKHMNLKEVYICYPGVIKGHAFSYQVQANNTKPHTHTHRVNASIRHFLSLALTTSAVPPRTYCFEAIWSTCIMCFLLGLGTMDVSQVMSR